MHVLNTFYIMLISLTSVYKNNNTPFITVVAHLKNVARMIFLLVPLL